jgi:hypothetical protein
LSRRLGCRAIHERPEANEAGPAGPLTQEGPHNESPSNRRRVRRRRSLAADCLAQLHDWRVTDTQHTVVHVADGDSVPVQIRTTLLFHPDGSFEVKVDSIGCGGPSN